MRFVVCARDRETGSTMLVSERSFPNRREAVDAIAECPDTARLLQADVFLVDLNAAAPVAVIGLSGPAPEGEGRTADDAAVSDEDAADGEAADESIEEAIEDAVRLGIGEMDIEAWTCEDCIYVITCEKSGTLRPVECTSFQWRA